MLYLIEDGNSSTSDQTTQHGHDNENNVQNQNALPRDMAVENAETLMDNRIDSGKQ